MELLDAHSFLWIYGFKFEHEIEISNGIKESSPIEKTIKEILTIESKLELEIYNPTKVVDIENLFENETEIDYIQNHRKMMEIGHMAEKIVLNDEIAFLKENVPELAEKVRLVSNNPKLGFDILSFETDGKQKQIEVKAISQNGINKSFIITRNEFYKSKTYSNYYICCVSNINSKNPLIFRIKNPNFESDDKFSIEPLTYKVTFE